jgi:hypothetical protein
VVALDPETLELFARTVRGVLAGDGADDRTAELDAAGWQEVLVTDPRAAVALVFGVPGELRARTTAVDAVAIEAMGAGASARLAQLGGVVYAHPRGTGRVAGAIVDGSLALDGLALGIGDDSLPDGRVALLARRGDHDHLVVAPIDAVERVPLAGMDPTIGLTRVVGAVPESVLDGGLPVESAAVAAACRRAVSYELIGLASTMLATTCEYAGSRVQFGQPIGAFQAVKHRLADVLVAVRAAEHATNESWDAPTPVDAHLAAMGAKCLAGRAARVAAENCLQVMGAIGFTVEHELHRFIARATVLDVMFGSARQLRTELGRALLDRGRVPRPGAP